MAFDLREAVYLQNDPLGKSKTNVEEPWSNVRGLFEGDQRFICGGMSWVLHHMLGEVGIPSRRVHLATEGAATGNGKYDTHVSVEAYIDGRWIAVDPTFNASFKCRGKLQGYNSLRECWKNGDPIKAVEGKLLPKNQVSSYKDQPGRRYIDHLYGIHYVPSRVKIRDDVGDEEPYSGWYEEMISLYKDE